VTDAVATCQGLILEARRRFEAAGIPDPATDAKVLICGLLEISQTDLLLRGNAPVDARLLAVVEQAIVRRLRREPVHRILGRRAFYGLELDLSPGTLEPRPDTEVLIDAILPHLRHIVAIKGSAEIVDLGTGTGAIALALLAECPQARAIGVDISKDALVTAGRNAEVNGLSGRFATRESIWFENLPERFDVIVSNPPYIRSDVVLTLEPEVQKFDPAAALDGGADGLDAYRAIAGTARTHLEKGGIVGLEIGWDQSQSVIQIFEKEGFFLVEQRKDLDGNDRVLLFAGADS
jgi:release factor glutamine methyltransferase